MTNVSWWVGCSSAHTPALAHLRPAPQLLQRSGRGPVPGQPLARQKAYRTGKAAFCPSLALLPPLSLDLPVLHKLMLPSQPPCRLPASSSSPHAGRHGEAIQEGLWPLLCCGLGALGLETCQNSHVLSSLALFFLSVSNSVPHVLWKLMFITPYRR